MTLALAAAFGLFGLVVGSFLNVVIVRRGRETVLGRSACRACRATLRWFDLIPIVSWVWLGGRCRACASRISAQYPLVEGATGALFALLGASAMPPLSLLLALPVAALLVSIFVYDLRHGVIPDEWVFPFALLALLWSASFSPSLAEFGYAALAGPALALPFFALWVLSQGRWMGLGDAKLALGMGWLLGPPLGALAVLFAFVLGAIVSLGILLPLPHLARVLGITSLEGEHARFTMKSEVPFGPFLVVGTFVLWLTLIYSLPIPLLS